MNRTEPSNVGRLVAFIYLAYVVCLCTDTVLSHPISRHYTVEYVHKTLIENTALMLLIVDACITKNVPQMKGYMVFKALNQFHFLISL